MKVSSALTVEPPAQHLPASLGPRRRAGLLLHVTSLPGPFGIGDLGPAAEAFLRWAAEAGQRLWQVLPLGPIGFGDSPYGGHSSFAGNPLLISLELLERDGWLRGEELREAEMSESDRVSYGRVRLLKDRLLRLAFRRFREQPSHLDADFEAFSNEPETRGWIDGWCLYAALKHQHGGASWQQWSERLRRRESQALEQCRRELDEELEFQRFCQWLFRRQWQRLRRVAAELDIEILGDLPIYPALDSADVWLAPELFELDAEDRPAAVAGVPPDYFSRDGQLWGNPVYRWVRHQESGFGWWIERVRDSLALFDRLRLDHFRGFESFWRVPAGAKTAAEGAWSPGPNQVLFAALHAALGQGLPLVAEDLGVITPEVEALLGAVDFPRMKVLQFAFDEPNSVHLPHRHTYRSLVYTGTHDNDTCRGWFRQLSREQRQRALEYLDLPSGRQISPALIRCAYLSVAETAIVPLQDVLELGSEGRMNSPGLGGGNWSWRVRSSELTPERAHRLRRLAEISGRLPPPPTQ